MQTAIKSYHSMQSIDIDSTQSAISLQSSSTKTAPMTKLTITDYCIVLLGGFIYCLIFFFRGSLTPIVDVLETEFRATSSEIGQMASCFYIGYTIMQMPLGLFLEIFNAEFVLLFGFIGFSVTVFLFGLCQNILYASVILSISGAFGSCAWLALLALIGQRMGNNQVPLWTGIVLFYTYFFLLAMNALQAYLWDDCQIWREVFYFLGAMCLFIGSIFCILIGYPQNNTDINDTLLSNNDEALHSLCKKCHFPIMRERRVSRSSLYRIKIAICNPWNYVLGMFLFAVAGIVLGFNGLWLIPFFMVKYGYQRSVATVVNNLFFVSSAFGGLIIGKLSTKFKKRKIFMMLSSLMLCGSALIVHLPRDTNIFIIITLRV